MTPILRARTVPTTLLTAAAVAALAGQASAQSFNIDLSVTSGVGSGAPSSSFGGAAGQAGTWNNVTSSLPQTHTLNNLAGVPTQVTLTRTPFSSGTFASFSDSDLSGSTVNLLCDGQTSNAQLKYEIGGLQAGRYAIYTYSGRAGTTNMSATNVATGLSPVQDVGGNPTSNDLVSGVSHAIHLIDVSQLENVFITVDPDVGGLSTCTGIQVKYLGPTGSGRARIYVDDSVSGTNDGGSWATAYDNIQTALDAARDMGAGNAEVWVAQGFYYPTTGTSRSAAFSIPNKLEIYGGFSGTETSLEQRTAPWFFITAMSGSIGGSSQSDNSYNVITMDGCDSTTIVDGFSIVRGQATGSGNQARGGGASLINSTPYFRNCKFLSNHAGLDGGAVLSTGGYPMFIDCLFYNNTTDGSGAAMYAHTAGYPYFLNVQFLGNDAVGDGGAVKLLFCPGYFTNCMFSGNVASFGNGGGIAAAGDSADDIEVTNCTFSRNNGEVGGGLYINNDTDCYIDNSILWGNTADTGGAAETQQRGKNASSAYIVSYTTTEGLSSNPLFVDADGADNIVGNTDDNCRLLTGSPCIDAASTAVLDFDFTDLDNDGVTFEFVPLDLDRKDRFRDDPNTPDTGPVGSVVDRGCYEFQPACRADWNQDGYLDAFDYDDFVSDYFNYVNHGIGAADYNDDGYTDAFDYDDFVSDYFTGCP